MDTVTAMPRADFPQDLTVIDGLLYYQTSGGGSRVWQFDPVTGIETRLPDASLYSIFVQLGGSLYFGGRLGTNDGLYRYDPATNSYSIAAGSEGKRASTLTEYNDKLYFFDRNLIEFDPAAGTVTDLGIAQPSPQSSSGESYWWKPVTFGGELFFPGTNGGFDSVPGSELWKLDASGSVVFADDVNERSFSAEPRYYAELGGELYFSAVGGRSDGPTKTLWKYDPVTGDSRFVADISNPTYITAAAGRLYMGGRYNGQSGLIEFDPQTDAVEVLEASLDGPPIEYNDSLYFSSNHPSSGSEFTRLELTTKAIERFDIDLGSSSSLPRDFVVLDGDIYFSARTNYYRQLWKYDPNTNQTSMADDVRYPRQITSVDGVLYYHISLQQIRKFDPRTGSRTAIASDVQTVTSNMVALGGKLYFSARVDFVYGFYSLDLGKWRCDFRTWGRDGLF